MELTGAIERLERTVRVCGSPDAGPAELRAALSATTELRSFIDARRAELIGALDAHPAAFPQATIADTSGCSLGEANREKQRTDTLTTATAMAAALSDGAITAGHVDVLTRAARKLDDADSAGLLGLDADLAAAASTRSIAEFDRYVKRAAQQLDRTDPGDRLERQRRAARVRHWTDDDGMWNLAGRFDPATGKDLASAIDAATDERRRAAPPATAPADAIERDQHLKALALADLVLGDASPSLRSGSPLVVIDATQADGAGGPALDWGYPVELPPSVLAELAGTADPDVVIVANGVVLHAPGRLDLGRATRLANRAQRRALAGLYSTCAVPGCSVHYDRCKLHHVIWWRHGGRTDLENLLPVCQHDHTRLHDDGWDVTLAADRSLTIRIPDGQVLRTDPPRRSAA
ncbi:MAG: HNH endonuclease [Actinomycetota bacterium]